MKYKLEKKKNRIQFNPDLDGYERELEASIERERKKATKMRLICNLY